MFLLYLIAKVVFVKRNSIILNSDSGIMVLKISINFILFMVLKADDRSILVIFIVHPDFLCLQLLFYEPIGCLLLT